MNLLTIFSRYYDIILNEDHHHNNFYDNYFQDTLKDFLQKRENGELLYQKRTKLEQTIFKKVRA